MQLNLEPTRQLAGYAKTQGFGNVHDYLVHTVTGETTSLLLPALHLVNQAYFVSHFTMPL
jgi:hypothetical protein